MTLNYKITVNDQSVEFISEKHNSLLSCLLDNNISAQYQCRDGFCGACKAKLKHGKVAYHNEPLAYIKDGEFLVCCSVPETDLEIEIVE